MAKNKYDLIIIGGGFYGCMIALFLRKYYSEILIIEEEDSILTQASYRNQARVHNGYHYPRNFLTGFRSHINYSKFKKDFSLAIDDTNTMLYAIARSTSKTTSQQFIKFCKQIGSPIKPVPNGLKNIFKEQYIEDSFMVDESVFNAGRMKKILLKKLHASRITMLYNTEAIKIHSVANSLTLEVLGNNTICANKIINCSYAKINSILQNSNLPLLPIKYEYAEMPLIQMPEKLRKVGITIMDGPFFSLMPFPDKLLHSFHHVRYTPHLSWLGENVNKKKLNQLKSNYLYMQKDAVRYIPLLEQMKYSSSLFQIKTLLQQNEENDGRPILYRKDYGYNNLDIVLGGKIDNIYDVQNELYKQNYFFK